MTIDGRGFDQDWYLSKNPDVASSDLDPYDHYVRFGWREGRDPNSIFDTSFYLATNRDVAAAGIDPLAHYLQFGWKESRDPSAAFDTSNYVTANGDVAAAHINPMIHYLVHGASEHRALALDYAPELQEGFDRDFYLRENPDVKNAGIDPYIHYQQFGNSESRMPNALFDKDYYLAQNPDVAKSSLGAFEHFMSFGWREGRDPSASFSLDEYSSVNPGSIANPVVRYLTVDRYSGLPGDFFGTETPQIIQSRGSPLTAILAGTASFSISGALTHVTASASPLDNHDLSGFTTYSLAQSTADISIEGQGRLPTSISFGTGDDRLTGSFDLEGQILNFFAGAGTLVVDAQFDNGLASLNGGHDGSNVMVRGSAQFNYAGAIGDDRVILGTGNDTISGGGGGNYLDGGLGIDLASWTSQVRADLLAGTAISLGAGEDFKDTLLSIENLGGSAFDDVLLGNDQANLIVGVNISPSGSGNDILAGRDGDDALWGFDGADMLVGGGGADALIGGEGDDLLIDGADGWGPNNRNPGAYGNEGNDTFVYLLGDEGELFRGDYYDGGSGADTYIVEAVTGQWGSLGLQFSQIDGDKLDLSSVRSAFGRELTLSDILEAASTPFYGSTTIDLADFQNVEGQQLSGRLVLNGVFAPSDLHVSDFIFSSESEWQAALPDYLFGAL